jgi:para-nitrobenzyl esterase
MPARRNIPMADAAIVTTDSGPVRGTVTDEYRLFQRIPYAGPTGGGLRWRSPQPTQSWSEPRDATKPGSMAPQQPSSYADVASLDEDCLFLNVTVPRSAGPEDLKPVMLWIHGDGAVGAGNFFDARRLAVDGDVVVVTINYRLSISGTFGYPGLEDSGTFGLQDQQAALRWVRRNAAGFGGDPGSVTLFGESYGALATTAHLPSPCRTVSSTRRSSRAVSRCPTCRPVPCSRACRRCPGTGGAHRPR